MKSKNLIGLGSMLAICLSIVIISACNKKFDEPDVFPDPNIPVTMTMKELKALHLSAGAVKAITVDKIIGGIVVADDRSGNFFKSISIQDATGGISVRLDGNNLFNSYPVGRRVYIKVKGLCISDYGGLVQLGAIDNSSTTLIQEAIPQNLFDKYIIKGSLGNVVTPRIITAASQLFTTLQDSIQSTLIQMPNFEFAISDTAKTYGDPTLGASALNYTIKNCSGSSITLRNSSYANFSGIKVPKGSGTITAIYTFFNGTKQLLIRDTSDVKFTNPRCGQGPTTLMNTVDVRNLYTGTPSTIPTGRRITGIVISDRLGQNTVSQNIILQQGNNQSGIIVRFDAAHTFDLGDSLDVNISGTVLDQFTGTLQVSGISTAFASKLSTGKTITPRIATIAQINGSITAWESTLLRINNHTITGGTAGNWGGNTTLNDGATIIHFTRTGTGGATFASTPYPTSTVTSLVGIAGKFNTINQIYIRNLADVVATGVPTSLLNEDFESTTTNTNIAISNWFNGAETGAPIYRSSNAIGTTKFAQATAFGSNDAVVKSWLVTRGVNLNSTTNEVLTFETRGTFANGAVLKVLVSTNYTGTGNPWTTGVTWTDITSSATLHAGVITNGTGVAFTPSGNVSLNSYSGTIYVAFRYEGADPTGTASDKTTNWQIDNIKIVGN